MLLGQGRRVMGFVDGGGKIAIVSALSLSLLLLLLKEVGNARLGESD